MPREVGPVTVPILQMGKLDSGIIQGPIAKPRIQAQVHALCKVLPHSSITWLGLETSVHGGLSASGYRAGRPCSYLKVRQLELALKTQNELQGQQGSLLRLSRCLALGQSAEVRGWGEGQTQAMASQSRCYHHQRLHTPCWIYLGPGHRSWELLLTFVPQERPEPWREPTAGNRGG